MKLTRSELEIMNVLWKAGRPLSRAEILELSEDKTWKDNSIHILLNGMLNKEAIHGDGFVRSGKVWGRLYAPSISLGEYYLENIFLPLGESFYPILFAAMLEDKNISPETLEAIRVILNKHLERMQ